MFQNTKAFSGFSVDDIKKAEEFYGSTLGVKLNHAEDGLSLHIGGGGDVFIYPKPNHEPASFTILNFLVDDIDRTVEELTDRGIAFEHYEGSEMETDEKGIYRGVSKGIGPDIAWFKDPAGNVLAVIEDSK